MITSSLATLSIYSDTVTAAQIAEALGMAGHEMHERGDPTRAALTGRKVAPGWEAYKQPHWCWDVPEELIDPEDESGFASVRVLVDVFAEKADALARLRPRCETIIWWSGMSDSVQGGFVIPADLLVGLAALGCDFWGTAFLHEEYEEDDDEEPPVEP